MVIEQLAGHHDRRDFDCGEPALNRFLQEQATQFRKRGLGVTYVAVSEGDSRVVGFYTISSGSVEPDQIAGENLPSRLRIPVILLGQFAVDRRCQGQDIGKVLLYDALRRCVLIADQLGVHGVILDALNEKAKVFYLKRGFVGLLSRGGADMMLYISIKEIRKLPILGRDDCPKTDEKSIPPPST